MKGFLSTPCRGYLKAKIRKYTELKRHFLIKSNKEKPAPGKKDWQVSAFNISSVIKSSRWQREICRRNYYSPFQGRIKLHFENGNLNNFTPSTTLKCKKHYVFRIPRLLPDSHYWEKAMADYKQEWRRGNHTEYSLTGTLEKLHNTKARNQNQQVPKIHRATKGFKRNKYLRSNS